jgi:hypothetical protein
MLEVLLGEENAIATAESCQLDCRGRSFQCACTHLGLCVGLGNVTIVQNRNQCAVRALE